MVKQNLLSNFHKKAHKELLDFLNWIAKEHPKTYKFLTEHYKETITKSCENCIHYLGYKLVPQICCDCEDYNKWEAKEDGNE